MRFVMINQLVCALSYEPLAHSPNQTRIKCFFLIHMLSASTSEFQVQVIDVPSILISKCIAIDCEWHRTPIATQSH